MSSKGKGKAVVHSSGGGRCVACELMGRACEPDCVFAPHFPAEDDPARFMSVHAAFGARNVERFLRRVGPEDLRAEAARYLVLNAPRRMAVQGAGETQPPCAACLHLGDECAPECVFARHFPAGDDPERFAAVDARFGAHDVAVFLCALSPEQQEDAVRNFVSIAQLPPPPPPPDDDQEAERRACAACQYLRRPCVPNCLFSTYFPPDDDPERFAAAHSAYGASNLDRRLRYLPPELRDAAAATSVYEARRRQEDPVYGALGDVLLCELYLKMTMEELAATRERLVPYVGREAAYRTFTRKPRRRIPPATMQQVQDRMQGVVGRVMQQVAAEAAAGVTTFLTPLHEKLVMSHSNAPGSSGASGPGPAQPATDAAAKDPGLPDGGEDAGDDANESSQAQDPGLQEGGEDAGDETSQGSAKKGKESAEGSSEA